MSKLSIEQASELVGKSVATIWRYKRAGVDVTDRDALLQYSQVKNTKAVGAARGKRPVSDAASVGELPEAGSPGAVAALKRLQNFEVDFARRLERALKSDNAELIQIARDDHVKIAEALRRYEREVEESKRDLGHLIAKSEAVKGARASAVWFRMAWRQWISSALPDVCARATSQSMRDAAYLCEITFAEILALEIRNSKGSRDEVVPDWAEQEIFESWHVKQS
jgi:hypothetical protein